MNINNLIRQLKFSGGCVLYTPPDPYRIYERLAILYQRGRVGNDVSRQWPIKLVASCKCSPFDIGKDRNHYGYTGYNPNYQMPLHFLKWVLQEIPECFWKFNLYIDMNIDTLIRSAENSNIREIWIDMSNKKRKLKCAILDDKVIDGIDSGLFYLPSYKQISHEVSGWQSNYKYLFGKINTQNIRMVRKGGDNNDQE